MPTPEPATPSPEDGAAARRREHLDGLLVRLQLADQMGRETAEQERTRSDEIENVTSEYIMNLLANAARADRALRAQLEEKGLLDTDGDPTVGTDIGEHLTREIARSMPTRLRGFTDGLVDAGALEDGIVRQLLNLVKSYREPMDPHVDRRKAA